MGDLLTHHTPHLRVATLGDLCLIRGGVLLHHLVKQDGWLREDGCAASFKSDNIWSVVASQPPSKVEISPKVFILMCFICICLFFSDFSVFFLG